MKGRNWDMLLRWLEGSLTDEEAREVREQLDQSEGLRAELESLRSMRGMAQEAVQTASSTALEPFFTDRLLRRLTPSREASGTAFDEELVLFLTRLFRPVALAGVILAICLAWYNVNLSNDYSGSTTTTEAVLALPPVASASVYDLDFFAAEEVNRP